MRVQKIMKVIKARKHLIENWYWIENHQGKHFHWMCPECGRDNCGYLLHVMKTDLVYNVTKNITWCESNDCDVSGLLMLMHEVSPFKDVISK